jgi:UDP-N-acetylmuramate--alanine ligase
MEKVLSGIKNIYLVGIGGIGMSGLAFLLKERGFNVKGSDIKNSYTVRMLKELGIEVFVGHKKENISNDIQLISYSSAVSDSNPEIMEAKRRGISLLRRAQLLALISSNKKVIAIAGSHGKTTVTSLLTYLLTSIGCKPTTFIGGLPLNYSLGAWWGNEYFVIETDESDGSFLECSPWVSIITNVDREHLDYYKNMNNLKKNFIKFAHQTKKMVIGCGDDYFVREILLKVKGSSYGFDARNKIRAKNLCFDKKFSCFDLFVDGRLISSVKVPLLGEHNVLNVLAAISFFLYIGEDLIKIINLLRGFKGTKRRFQIKYRRGGVTFMDDYAHHPTEIRMVLKAASYLKCKRLFVIFEPHRFSRLKLLWKEFSRCFSSASKVIITDIYSAHEAKIGGIDEKFIVEKIKENFSGEVEYLPKNELKVKVPSQIKKGDLVIGLGAGEIDNLMAEVVDEFKKVRVKA